MCPCDCSLNYSLLLSLTSYVTNVDQMFLFPQVLNVCRDQTEKILAESTVYFVLLRAIWFLPAQGHRASVLNSAVLPLTVNISLFCFIHNICIRLCRWCLVSIVIFSVRQKNSPFCCSNFFFLFDIWLTYLKVPCLMLYFLKTLKSAQMLGGSSRSPQNTAVFYDTMTATVHGP